MDSNTLELRRAFVAKYQAHDLAGIDALLTESPELLADPKDARRMIGYPVMANAVDVMEVMDRHGVDWNVIHSEGRPETALWDAAAGGCVEAVRFLLDHGVTVNQASRGRPAHCSAFGAACSAGSDEVARILIGAGADLNAIDHIGQTCLDAALQYGRNEVAALIRERGGKRASELPPRDDPA